MTRHTHRLFTLTATALVAAGFAGLAPGFSADAVAADPERGKVLYETRCTDCHNRGVHQSASRRATSFEGIRMQVTRWTRELGGSWDEGDIDNITVYLNDLYYKLPCPPAACASTTGALGKF
jgi:mono/diheme cytochrome c family protein